LLPVRRLTASLVILVASCTLSACGKDAPLSSKTATGIEAPPATTTIPPRSARDGCEAVETPEPKANPNRRLARERLSRKSTYVAVLQTNCGTIRIQLANLRAPKTTSSFAGLARNGFYDGLTFHRIAKPGGNDYVIQGGDPLLNGNGGPGYSVVEAPAKRTRYVKGVVAMAKSAEEAPGTSGSQFFIVTADLAPLPPDYAVLGRVVAGNNVVRRIADLATDPATEMPIDPVVIKTIEIVRR
jgi:peptidyl-prolyl cis-trans isomerase B (cyclophilin B)